MIKAIILASTLLVACTVAPSTTVTPSTGVDQSTIGATLVPFGLHCEEDEVIAFDQNATPTVDGLPLGCVHVDTIRGEQ